MDKLFLPEYLKLAEQYEGTPDFLGFGAVVHVVCARHGIAVEHDINEIIVHASTEIIAAIEI